MPYFLICKLIHRVRSSVKEDILTVREVAEMLKLADKTVYSLVSDGEIPGFKVGGSWRFSKKELEKWVAAQNRKASENKKARSDKSKYLICLLDLQGAEPIALKRNLE